MFKSASLISLPRPIMIMIMFALIIAISVAFFSVPMYAASVVIALPVINLSGVLPALTAAGATALFFYLKSAGLELTRHMGNYIKAICVQIAVNGYSSLVSELNSLTNGSSLSDQSASALNDCISGVGSFVNSNSDIWNSYNSISVSGTDYSSDHLHSVISESGLWLNCSPAYLDISASVDGSSIVYSVSDIFGSQKSYSVSSINVTDYTFVYYPDSLSRSGSIIAALVLKSTSGSLYSTSFVVHTPFYGTTSDSSYPAGLQNVSALEVPLSGLYSGPDVNSFIDTFIGSGVNAAGATYSYPVAAQDSYPVYNKTEGLAIADGLNLSSDMTISSDYTGSNTTPDGGSESDNVFSSSWSWAEGVISSILDLLRTIIQKIQAIFDAYLPTCVSSALYISMLILVCLWVFRLIIDR